MADWPPPRMKARFAAMNGSLTPRPSPTSGRGERRESQRDFPSVRFILCQRSVEPMLTRVTRG